MKKVIIIIGIVIFSALGVWYALSRTSYVSVTAPTGSVSTNSEMTPYSSSLFGFDVSLPAGFTVDEAYLNQDLGPGREIPGVAFRIPASFSSGTNLSSDSFVSVEALSGVECTPADFLSSPGESTETVMGDIVFTNAESSGAGLGNRYDEKIHVTHRGERCYGVRYYIHSTTVDNYEPGTVREFDRENLISSFDMILASFKAQAI